MDKQSKSAQRQELEDRWVPVLQASPSTEEVQYAYDEHYAIFEQEGMDRSRKTGIDGTGKVIIGKIGTGKAVLEIGFGNAVLATKLAERGNTVVGIDISEFVVKKANARLDRESTPSLRFEHGDARTLGFADASFDYVVSRNLVEHLTADDARRHLREVWRVLRMPGCYLFSVPNRIFAGYRSAGFHLHMYSLHESLELASSVGFTSRWIEPAFRHIGMTEVPTVLTRSFLRYESALEKLERAFPALSLKIGRHKLTPTVMVAAHKSGAALSKAKGRTHDAASSFADGQ